MDERQGQQRDAERALREEALLALPRWLETRRWYSDKGRDIAMLQFEDLAVASVAADWLALSIVRVAFDDGDVALYFLPLAITSTPGDTDQILPAPVAGFAIVDATERPWFGGWLLERFSSGADDPAAWQFTAAPGADDALAAARKAPATVMRAEQSNSSLRFDELMLIKLFRRLQPGPNPDEEILRGLADADFAQVPRYLGAGAWRAPDGTPYPIALALAFAPNVGDGWAWLLHRLRRSATGSLTSEPDPFAAERLLGQRTAELHVALSQIGGPDFFPVPQDETGIETNRRRTSAAIAGAADLLLANEARLPGSLRAALPQAIAGLRALGARAAGFGDELGLPRIRVHGDYHLGQTLRTPDGDWVIIDFEGEPARPVAERRQRLSPLKDVAGMLRSFAYARGAILRSDGFADNQAVETRLATWERGARAAFLAGYRTAVAATRVPLVPADDADFARALAAWELDKALYEIAYEARNRPDWLELPLRTLVPDLGDQFGAATGGAPA